MDIVSLHHHSMPVVDSPLYQRYHKAVRSRFGKASNYVCWLCDEDSLDWAWIHNTDPSDPDNYIPLCRFCHQDYDRADWLKEERKRERARIEQANAFKGWTPERREEQRNRMLLKWSKPGERERQAERAVRDRPWEGRRPKNGGGAR